METVNKVRKQILINWKELEWLQTEETKNITDVNMDKLKESLKNNGFIQPFNVWHNEEENKSYILDGHHRRKAMLELEKEGCFMFDCELPANVIDCKDRKEAIKYLLLYSSNYALINKTGLANFLDLEQINIDELLNEVAVQDINLEEFKFEPEDFSDKNEEVNVDDFEEEMIMKFKFKEHQFLEVQQKLADISDSQEKALLEILGITDEEDSDEF